MTKAYPYRPRPRRLLGIPALFIGTILLLTPRVPAQTGPSPTTITLASDPTPEALVSAREALGEGSIIVMNGADWEDFDGLLDLPIVPDTGGTDFAGTATGPTQQANKLSIMAVHLGSDNVLDEFTCYTVPASATSTAQDYQQACSDALQQWEDQELSLSSTSSTPEPLAGDYTPLLRIQHSSVFATGTHYENIRTYRLNDTDPTRDWYLVARDPASAPNFDKCTNSNLTTACGWVTHRRDFQTSLAAPFNSNPKFQLFAVSPSSPQGDEGQLTIGGGLGGVAPFVGVEYTVSWGQQRVSTDAFINMDAKESSWVENFGTTGSSPNRQTQTDSQYFQSHNASIYQVPEGTSEFSVIARTRVDNIYYNPGDDCAGRVGCNHYNSLSSPYNVVPLMAPIFTISTNSITLLPKGKAYVYLEAHIPDSPWVPAESRAGDLAWTAGFGPGTSGLSISQSHGTGPGYLTISANGAAPGSQGTIEFDTNPAYAAGSVVKGPLILQVNIATGVSPRVLLAGGKNWNGQILSSAELWNPATNTSVLTGSMANPRQLHTATQLADGSVLVTGGYDQSSSPQSSVEIYNPATGQFSPGPSMIAARAEHTATLFKAGPLAGDVLIAGGAGQNGNALSSAELYNPVTNTFTSLSPMHVGRMRHTATSLADGRILVAGGTLSQGRTTGIGEAEIFDPTTMQWSQVGNLHEGRQGQSAALLTTGQVLIAGGFNPYYDPTKTAELFSPNSNQFTYTLSPMTVPRRYASAVSLVNGQVLVAGGFNGASTAELFDPSSETFSAAPVDMTEQRDKPNATFLLNTNTSNDGMVLFAGGVVEATGSSGGKLIELFDPATNTFARAGNMTTPRTGLTATLIGTSY